MYTLQTPLELVKGIGPLSAAKLAKNGLKTVLDLLLWLPLRYEDRSQMVEIKDLQLDQLVTIRATVQNARNFYKGRRSIQSATVFDSTGKLKLMWFNNSFIVDSLKPKQEYFVSGKLNDRGVMLQPLVEKISSDTIHTARLIPIYSQLSSIKQGSLRRLLKHILDTVQIEADPETLIAAGLLPKINRSELFQVLHFPDDTERVILARERLALEELVALIQHSQQAKAAWQAKENGFRIDLHPTPSHPIIPTTIPFALTKSQHQAVGEILEDLQAATPMNRLLLGDVGAGKTVVAGIAMHHVRKSGFASALIAPTQLLAEQHALTLKKLFPDFEIELLTSKTSKTHKNSKNNKTSSTEKFSSSNDSPKIYVGTHSVINRLPELKPALIIYDEQHRFGVSQRTFTSSQELVPNILTMSATPIPRSLMLTLFSHLSVSHLSELPPGRVPVKSWVVPKRKKEASWNWLADQILNLRMQVFVVCPFIDTSETAEFEQVAAANAVYEELSNYFEKHFPQLKLGLLHGKMSEKAKTKITAALYDHQLDILVTTPVIEVGLDVPTASAIVIESAERFGLASLHQLRGRVGRAGQQAYCLLFTSRPGKNQRLEDFVTETNGLKLAELDLQRRGAGDLFGTAQSGLDQLKFANWTNLQLITQARQLFDFIQLQKTGWQPLITTPVTQNAEIAAN